MSTVTSANWQPPTPTRGEARRRTCPISVIGIMPSFRQASFQVIFASPLTRSLPSLSERSSGLASRRRGDLREQRVAGLGRRRRRHGGAHRRGGGRAARGLAGGERRVADVRLDVGRLQAEDLGGDDRQDRPGAGADVLGGALHLDRAVGVDDAGDLLVLRCRRRPTVQGHAEAALDRPLAVLAARLAVASSRSARRPSRPRPRRSGVLKSFSGEVLEPELQRVDPELVGQVVHRRFHDRRSPGGGPGPAWRGRRRR